MGLPKTSYFDKEEKSIKKLKKERFW